MSRRSDSRDSKVTIDNIVKVGTLGIGSQGTVWSARVRHGSSSRRRSKGVSGAPYALKQRLVTKTDAAMRSSKSSSALREIEFYRRVANRYPAFFTRLYDWKLEEATQEMVDSIGAEDGKTEKIGRETGEVFTHILTTLSARKEGVLRSIYHSLDRAQWLSMLSQVCYAIALIHDKGFSHGDVWEANVAFERVPWARDISIYRSSVPSLGFQWSIIDYGSIELKVDESRREKTKKRASSYDLDDMISLASGEDDAVEYCGKDAVDMETPAYRKKVLNSIDGPSVKAVMRQTGLPLDVSLALMNLDSYVWHLCRASRDDSVGPKIDRGSLLELADANASYGSLATMFARLAREAVKEAGKKR